MINEFELLLVLAQLGVAFAGFGTVASVLQRNQGRDDARVDAGRLLHVLFASLSLTALSLLPGAVSLFGLPEKDTWAISGAISAIVIGVALPGIAARSMRMRKYPGFSTKTVLVNLAIICVAFALHIMCAFNALPGQLPGLYVAASMCVLLNCSIGFFRITSSLLRPHLPD